jgi:hypothetical protein
MLDRLGPSGILAALVCAGGLIAAVTAGSTIAGILAAAAAIFVVTRFLRKADA